eukprot:jgi/Ulvmu1/2250/UM013_0097.1
MQHVCYALRAVLCSCMLCSEGLSCAAAEWGRGHHCGGSLKNQRHRVWYGGGLSAGAGCCQGSQDLGWGHVHSGPIVAMRPRPPVRCRDVAHGTHVAPCMRWCSVWFVVRVLGHCGGSTAAAAVL